MRGYKISLSHIVDAIKNWDLDENEEKKTISIDVDDNTLVAGPNDPLPLDVVDVKALVAGPSDEQLCALVQVKV